jgi:cutinase
VIQRLTTASLCLLVFAGCGTASTGSPAPASSRVGPLASTTCADLVVLGVRGSGQAADLNRGVGKEVLRTVTDLARLVTARSGASVRLEAVPYDASGTATTSTYFDHVSDGARLAEQQADALVRRCPSSRIAVVGFSQGANVVHELADDVPAFLARRVALVAMIADPTRDPADDIRHWSYADAPVPRPGLLGTGAPVDDDVRAVAISLCHASDEVCNRRGVRGEKTSPAHRYFYERPTTAQQTAEQLDLVLRSAGV